jgi:hypothetical protein
MDKKENMKLTEGSLYKILSIGGREHPLETEGIFKGYANLSIEESGLLIELSNNHGELQGKTRIIPIHAVLAVDLLDIKEDDNKEDTKDTHHYYG